MKKFVGMLIVFVIVCSCMTGLAETDYSYLQDMSVNELKELRSEINKILGEDEDTTQVTEFPAVDDNGYEVSVSEPHYKIAIQAVNYLKSKVKIPSSLKINRVAVSDSKVWIFYSANNAFGAALDATYDYGYDSNGNKTHGYNYNEVMGIEGCEDLIVDFIVANME